ncbi:MAG: alpha/beta fold hydrolase [Holophagales bacterium]|nr:alpha/beta fold hydrolase [Holophagales bacterium]
MRLPGRRAAVFLCRRPQPQAPIRLLCFPYAGGGASIYRRWQEDLAPGVEVISVQPPGRENRLADAPHLEMAPLIAEILSALAELDSRPLALFGHSLGACVAYELAHVLSRHGRPPAWLAVSGRRAPGGRPEPVVSTLDDAGFLAHLRDLGGTPEEILENDELMELLMPLLRADFALLERYRPTEGPPLECPMVAYGGEGDDDAPPDTIEAWRPYAGGSFDVEILPGGHFYLHGESEPALRRSVAQRLLALPREPAGGQIPSR